MTKELACQEDLAYYTFPTKGSSFFVGLFRNPKQGIVTYDLSYSRFIVVIIKRSWYEKKV